MKRRWVPLPHSYPSLRGDIPRSVFEACAAQTIKPYSNMSQSQPVSPAVSPSGNGDPPTDAAPDPRDQALEEDLDNVVPTRGYQMLPMVGLGGSAGSIPALQAILHRDAGGFRHGLRGHPALSPDHESTLPEIAAALHKHAGDRRRRTA